MKRELGQLANQHFDVCVIGGGIHGAWIAWDAALRGLSVALIERSDFGSATSANSLRIVHGGLRYLQNGDIKRMRESIRERSILLRVAPHLVHPLPILIPLFGHGTRGPEAMRMALALTDIIGIDRNRGLDEGRSLPSGRVISAERCRARMPGLRADHLTGGAIWYDAQMYDSERLTLAVVQSAVGRGAVVANYVEATSLINRRDRVVAVAARDQLSGDTFAIAASVVINAAGPWAGDFSSRGGAPATASRFTLSKAFNVAVPRLFDDMAIGIPVHDAQHQSSRLFFATPWREHTILGTAHLPYDGPVDEFAVTGDDVRAFVAAFRSAYPESSLSAADVIHIYPGMLPALPAGSSRAAVEVADHPLVCRDGKSGGPHGLITVTGVKYTTARSVAETAVDEVYAEMGIRPAPCMTPVVALHGGDIPDLQIWLKSAAASLGAGVDDSSMRHLAQSYGTVLPELVQLVESSRSERGQPVSEADDLLEARVRYAVRFEMAQRLLDVLYRRTDLGVRGHLTPKLVEMCASWMAAELDWDRERLETEIETVETSPIFAAA